jgi:hypothetical protein
LDYGCIASIRIADYGKNVMMGHREQLRGGGEWDALTRSKRFHRWRAGVRSWIKRKFNKRQRQLKKGYSSRRGIPVI